MLTKDDYDQEQRLIKKEYKYGLMDPSREVARIEKKRNKPARLGNKIWFKVIT